MKSDPNNPMENTHATHFLPIGENHQLSGLRDVAKFPKGITQEEDGSLRALPARNLDGWKEVKPGFYVPCILECADRLHAIHGGKTVEYRCGSQQAEKPLKVITCADCDACPFRKGRRRG
jgi:hypothetical protein